MLAAGVLLLIARPAAFAQSPPASGAPPDRVIVTDRPPEDPIAGPFLPDVQGTRINSGKKTSVIRPDDFPDIINNNFRQVFATTPGVLVSEEPSSPIINLGYRGLDSQRSEFSQVLKDGISIKNEQFGFPESHYTPALDAIERIEFIRGGAALQFGPQPGGAFNFVTRQPTRGRAFVFDTKQVFGSDGLFTSFNSVDGTVGPLGYYVYYQHRERDGFREANSDFDLNEGSVKLLLDAGANHRLTLTLDAYEEEHGEPGGLTFTPGPNAVLYDDDREASSRFFDRFRLRRYAATLAYDHVFSDETQFSLKAFGGYLSRYSRRQRGAGFGTLPSGSAANSNSIQLREAYTAGAEARLRHDYALFGNTHTLATGVLFYHADQPRVDRRGAAPDARSGQVRNRSDGETFNGAFFAENRFEFGPVSITPGVRLETVAQSVSESVNVAKAEARAPLSDRSDTSFVPLFGVGAAYVILPGHEIFPPQTAAEKNALAAAKNPDKNAPDPKDDAARAPGGVRRGPARLELYGNFSQAYRPITYAEAVPTSANGVVNGDLEEGHSLQYELGVRGRPWSFLTVEASGFLFTFDDQVGDISLPGGITSTGNVGDARHYGFEAGVEFDVLGAIAAANKGKGRFPFPGKLNLYGNVTLIDAEFTGGPNKGRAPAYAPDYQVKTGLIYHAPRDQFTAALLGTFVGDHYADSNNTPARFIPAYATWDFTVEAKIFKDCLGIVGGVNNLFDEDHYARVRDEGIDPAVGRNFYIGARVHY